MKNIDESRSSFDNYKNEYLKYIEEDLTESDTRSKLIDNLLINVLGWQEEDIKRETHTDSAGYYDYKISVPGINFIIEAKKQFKKFNLPSNHKNLTVKSLLSGNAEVVTQIRKYTIDEDTPYGVITNGSQFILLKTYNTDGKSWKDNICLIFNGIKDVEDRFIDFFENLSKYGIINNGTFKYYLSADKIEFKTVLSTLVDKDKELIRNSLSAKIVPIIRRIFGEIFSEEKDDDIEFIKNCFVENEETKKNKSEIEKLFADSAPSLSRVIPAVNFNSIATQISEEINQDEITIKNNFPPKPIVIIGSKGAGKTTFINHLFKYKINKEELENHLVLYIDFRKFFEIDTNFEQEKIASEIIERLYEKYDSLCLHSLSTLKRIYFKDIKRNDDSIWLNDKKNDEIIYNEKLSRYLEEEKRNKWKHLELLAKYLIRERRKRLIIIIDNADQLNDKIQGKIFLFAHALTKTTLCGTVVSLREGYYYRWYNSHPFDAYESNVYHITAPNYREVLQKRIEFALTKCKDATEKIKGADDAGKTWEFSSDDLIAFLSSLKNSLFSNENSKIVDFLRNTTYPNIREGLTIFQSFLVSGHTKVSEYIIREHFRKDDTRRSIPEHEFVKSIGLQNKHYYNSETSIINNIFTPPIGSKDHFINLYIINEIYSIARKRNYNDNLISNAVLIEKFSDLGYQNCVINNSLMNLFKSSLIETDQHILDIDLEQLPYIFNLCLTLKGYYYLKELIYKFYYYDLILQDTPIFKKDYFDSICSKFPQSRESGQRNLSQRTEVVKMFIEYLENMESEQPLQIIKNYGNLTKTISGHIKEQIAKINQKQSNYRADLVI